MEIIQLAVTRPVFRGLRPERFVVDPFLVPSSCSDETRFQGIATLFSRITLTHPGRIPLAVTRPVFRGLRPSLLWKHPPQSWPPPCSDETRFQGIATLFLWPNNTCSGPTTCSDETRFQGIATLFSFSRFPGRRQEALQ